MITIGIVIGLCLICFAMFVVFEHRETRVRYGRWLKKQEKGWTLNEFAQWDKLKGIREKQKFEELLDKKYTARAHENRVKSK